MSTPRLFLVDGYSNIYRAFYAIRGLSSSKGEPTNAVYGFLNMLRKLLREEAPELIGIALDVSEPTLRSERYEEYKANRAPMPDDLRPQIPWIRKLLAAYRIPSLELAGYEADDVLGTVSRRASEAGYEVVMVSADKDLMQLVGPGVSLYHTGREKLYDAAEVEADFGVPPPQVADVLALMGDSVDNVPGVPGIGKKGALGLVREYGSVEALLERTAEVSRKSYREGLQEHREQALMSKELVTIHTDLDLAFEPDSLRLEPPDEEALREIFSQLEFFSLLEELGPGGGPEDLEPAVEVVDAAGVGSRLASLGESWWATLVGSSPPVGLAVGAETGEALWFDFRRPGLLAASREALARFTSSESGALVGHDLKEVLRLLPGRDAVRVRLDDLMLFAYLINPALKGTGLEAIALETLGRRAVSLAESGFGKGQEPPPGDERLLALAADRVDLVRTLVPRLREELDRETGLTELYERIEAPLLAVLVRMEEAGIRLDVEFLRQMSRELSADLERLEAEIVELAGESFNIGSPRQLGEILFEKLGYPVLKRTRKTKSYSTDAETLEELANRGYPLPGKIIEYRELSKLRSTYVDALPELVGEDGRLHTRYDQAVAATGRLSSNDPNLQNIPVRTEVGRQIRRAFLAAPGQVLLIADYSQVELRVLAHIAQEESMIQAFAAGRDIHATTAARVFGGSPELVTADQRRAAKVINFGIIYGMSAFGLSKTLRIPPKEAKAFIEAYLERYPGVEAYTRETLARAEEEGMVSTLYGRIRRLPELKSRNYAARENAKRMAINARIQGTAADLLKLAMIAVDARLRRDHPESRLLLTVHDELVLEVPEAEVEAVAAAVQTEMEGVAELSVPLVVEVGWGASWYEAKGG